MGAGFAVRPALKHTRPSSVSLFRPASRSCRRLWARSRLDSFFPVESTMRGWCMYTGGVSRPSICISAIWRAVELMMSSPRTTCVMPSSISSTHTANW